MDRNKLTLLENIIRSELFVVVINHTTFSLIQTDLLKSINVNAIILINRISTFCLVHWI
jgi:hypothetical protein